VGVSFTGVTTNGNVVQGCRIGVNAAGTAALPNGTGVEITNGTIVDPFSITIGGNTPAHGNVISGNTNAGVSVSGIGARNVFVRQNFIGPNAAGTAKVPNRIGVAFGAGTGVSAVGGGLAGEGNLISGNSLYGVYLTGVANGVRVGNNLIGTDVTGTVALGNGAEGIFIQDAANITIGGPQPTAGNVISGNGESGVRISGSGSTSSRLQGNRIGTNAAGTAKLP